MTALCDHATSPEHVLNSSHRYGHTVRDQHNKDNARVINGDVFNISASEDLINLLPCATGAGFDALNKDHEPSCLPGTRINVLNQINTWSKDGSDRRCVFWLSGMAGTGKSTVARTVAREQHAQKRPRASFFFSRGGGDVGNARSFFTTIAFQLTRTSAALKRCILDAVNENRDIAKRALTEQWRLLILEPLAIAGEESPQLPLLLVIDALDECDSGRDVQLILKLLASASTHIPYIQLRVLVTSRPDTPIRLGFRENPGNWHRDLVLNEVPREIVDHDITIYFSQQLKDIISPQDAYMIVLLVERAYGLFIWAATVCRFVKNGKRFASKRLSTILEKGMTASTPEKDLDQIYITILLDSISGDYEENEKDELFSDFRNVVGAIVILFNPLSSDALALLLHISERDVKGVLLDLHSVLEVPASSADPVRLLHPSFRDFLLSDARCQESRLRINEMLAHRTLGGHCIQVMSSSLRRDICGLQRPGSLLSDVTRSHVDKCIGPELHYACLYWVQHLQKSDMLLHDEDEVRQFLCLHLLHWLEALAWLRRTPEAILALITLEDQIQADKSPSLHELVRDAKRFAIYNRGIIEEAPLQLYCSALIFAPEKSIIRIQFHQDIPGWIQTKPKVQLFWDTALQTLEGHSGSVSSIAFSPDGKSVVSGSGDKTVQLWDAATGSPLQTLEGHSDWVSSVAFSPDGRSVVSGSGDKTVRLWDAVTGAPLQTLEGHSGSVHSVAFSPDGMLVVSGSADYKVRLWDAATGAPLQTLEGHSGSVKSVAFSPDGRSVVSGSGDNTVRFWDAATGAPLQTLGGHSGPVSSVAFSPDGRLVVSGSRDKTVQLWDAATGAPLRTLEGHCHWVNSIAFSSDGRSVASGSSDETVRLWDAATGAPLQALEGHSDWVNSVAFSPDGRSVVSGSRDETVRLWDAATGAPLQTLKGHSGWVNSVAFSLDGGSVVSRSRDGTGRLREVATDVPLQTLKGHSRWVNPVTFSLKGRSAVSGSYNETVRLWDAATGAPLQTPEGYSSSVSSAAFSPDGKSVETLLLSGNWVKEGEENLLWLHPDHRGQLVGSLLGIFVLAQPSGRILIIRFKEGPKAM